MHVPECTQQVITDFMGFGAMIGSSVIRDISKQAQVHRLICDISFLPSSLLTLCVDAHHLGPGQWYVELRQEV